MTATPPPPPPPGPAGPSDVQPPAPGRAPGPDARSSAPDGSAPAHDGRTPAVPATPASGGTNERAALEAVREQIGRVVVGQDGVVTGLIVALLVRGHVLLEGVPGVAKTLLATTLARTLDLQTTRVQFTPDLMPADVTGQTILDEAGTGFRFREGPVFTNLLVADEINRTPPRTQAALLEAMQERQVSVGGVSRALPDPFLVVATQNPVEHEGTYPLPEAQLDRFLLKLLVPYPSIEEERLILARHERGTDASQPMIEQLSAVAGAADLDHAREAVRNIPVHESVRGYIVDLVRATRESPSELLGVSPRGATMLLHAAKAWAWLGGRAYVTPDEVKAMAKPTLRHRVQLRPELALDGADADDVLDQLLRSVAVPR